MPLLNLKISANYFSKVQSVLQIVTNTVAFVTKFFHFATKISGEVANLQLIFNFALLKQKG